MDKLTDQSLFRIHPALKDYIRRESEEEYRLLEDSLLAEGCRDPLVVWKEENVLVDGHHRFEICERHNISFEVVYRSFPDVKAVKVWMRTNQLSRRNLDKAERDQWIKELRAEGWTQKEIAGIVRVHRNTVNNTLKDDAQDCASQNSDKSTPTQNLEAIIAERVAVMKEQMEAETRRLREELEALKRAPRPEPVIVEKVKPVPSPELDEALRQKEEELKEREEWVEATLETERKEQERLMKIKEADLQKLLTRKMKEIDDAAKAGVELSELTQQKERLLFEIANLKNDLNYETRADNAREQFRKASAGVVNALRAVELINEKILRDPIFCRLTADEISIFCDDMTHMRDAAAVAVELSGQLLEQLKEARGLHVV